MSEAFDYAEAKADADELIAEFGQEGVLSRPTASGEAYNPVAGQPENYDVTLVVLDYTDAEITSGAGRILMSDKHVFISAGDLPADFTVKTSDKVLIGTSRQPHAIERVRPLNPGGVTVLIELQCRS